MNVSRSPLSVFLRAGVLVISVACYAAAAAAGYVQDNLVSNIPGLAANTDPNLRNPWGVTSGPATPFWVSDNVTGVQTLYKHNGHAAGVGRHHSEWRTNRKHFQSDD